MFKTGLILAGGQGTRLRPLTNETPKPLLPIGEKPIIERIILGLKDYGISDIFISVNYKKNMIENYLKQGKSLAVNIRYLEEKKCTGTAGSLSLLPSDLQENIVVINGDLLTNINFYKLHKFFENGNYDFVITVVEKSYKLDFGVVWEDENNCLDHWIEKPVYSYHINAGIYGISRIVVDYIRNKVNRNSYIDMPDLWKLLINDEFKIGVYIHKGDWFDIGKIEDYKYCNSMFEKQN